VTGPTSGGAVSRFTRANFDEVITAIKAAVEKQQ
jgi:hypothetical protein